MATRYGGTHSPGGDPRAAETARPGAGRVPARFGARLNILFVAPFLIGISGFWQDPVGLAQHMAAFAVLMGSAWMTREGIRAEDAYNARRVARRPAIPRKLIGSVLMGAGLALAGAPPGGTFVAAVIFAVLGTLLHAFSFGADPMRDKTEGDADLFQTDRVARVVEEAERALAEMRAAIAPLGDRHLNDRVAGFADVARAMCRKVEDDPRDLSAARKYLGVYLTGARDASRKFADIYARRRDETARTAYEALLNDLEKSFAARTEKLMLDEKIDLGVEIDVLRERLERDGVRVGSAQAAKGDEE